MELKTPLYETHVKYKGKIVPFAGYLLPVQYESGVIAEHMAVRTGCGLFDVSHMGEITCIGTDAVKNLNHLLTNDYTTMYDGQARYSPMCNEDGGVVDDLIVYKVREDHYFIVVNAANKDKDFAWMKAHESGDAVFTDISADVAQIALQGPKAEEILRKLVPEEDIPKKYYSALFHRTVGGMDCIISRTGYTGEDGFEFYLAAAEASKLWELLLETGKEEGLIPCGLGARDTLRLEAAMPLYGHEMDDTITPLEAGLGMFVKMDKEEFIGKDAILQRGPLTRKRVGLKVTGRGIIREHTDVYAGDKKVGITTSGTHCPYLKAPVAMALLDVDYTAAGTKVEAEVRGRRVAAEVVPLPFYRKGK
ncbi:MAG: glycine cleavage system aminomethyltransferase GcvT [Candidatus Choladocola sp.]|nr:glycine cleavage system aminomethyltransferase GcvT [Candidatus Choladocola sp.]